MGTVVHEGVGGRTIGSWESRAACRWTGVQLFFDSERADRAKRVCESCPVVPDCLRAALIDDPEGVWGGLTASQRHSLLPMGPRRQDFVAALLDRSLQILFLDGVGNPTNSARASWAQLRIRPDGIEPRAHYAELGDGLPSGPPRADGGRLRGKEIADLWVSELRGRLYAELHYVEMRSRLVDLGYRLPGQSVKAELRNVYQAAASDSRLSKARPGVFALRDAGGALPPWLDGIR